MVVGGWMGDGGVREHQPCGQTSFESIIFYFKKCTNYAASNISNAKSMDLA